MPSHVMSCNAILVILVVAVAASSSMPLIPRIVTLPDGGAVEGIVCPLTNVTAYKGIPFAEAPVGELRFMPPVRIKPWSDDTIYNATVYGNACHAVGKGMFVSKETVAVDEDCLSLNVFVPPGHDRAADPPLPVMVWIHGGGFQIGSTANDGVAPDPSVMVTEGEFIYVSMNYRLGPLGFLAFPDTDQGAGAGVLGLLDQQVAMRWVQRNIGAFGGDPTNVTLAGESAGALSICFHLTAPSNAGLFHRVIMMSAICDWSFQSLDDAHQQARALARALDCVHHRSGDDHIACLRTRAPHKIQEALPGKRGMAYFKGVRWFPVLSPAFVARPPLELIREGRALTTDVLLGCVSNEGSLFIMIAFPLMVWPGMFEATLDASYLPEEARQLKAAFPASWSERQKTVRMMTDMFTCSVLRTAKALASLNADVSSSEVFLYYYALQPGFTRWPLRDVLGVFHGSELSFLFNRSHRVTVPEQEMEVVNQMGHYWSQFIHSGDANRPYLPGHTHSAAPHWPEFDVQRQLFWTFNESSSPEHRHVRSAHAHEDAARLPISNVFNDDIDPSPFALCHFYDQFLTEDRLVRPVAEFDEPLPSYVINVVLIRALRAHPWLCLFIVVGALLLHAYSCGHCCARCYGCCCRRCGQKTHFD